MKVVLDKTFVSKCRFDAVPVVDDAGRVTSTEPNTKGRFYDVRDAHPDAPTGFALRVNKTSKTYILLMRQGAKVVTVTVGRHPNLLIGKDVPADRNARLLAAELSVRIRRGENVNDARKEECAYRSHAMSVAKTQVVSVRVEPSIKAALQSAAEREMRSLANMVEVMVVTYCRTHGYPLEGVPDETLPHTNLKGSVA